MRRQCGGPWPAASFLASAEEWPTGLFRETNETFDDIFGKRRGSNPHGNRVPHRIKTMFLLSPRFLALPLIALTVIVMLPRQPDASQAVAVSASRSMVVKAVTCAAPNAAPSCVVATSNNSVVR